MVLLLKLLLLLLVVIVEVLVDSKGLVGRHGGVRANPVVRMQAWPWPLLVVAFRGVRTARFGGHVRAIMLHHVVLPRKPRLAPGKEARKVLFARMNPIMPGQMPASNPKLVSQQKIVALVHGTLVHLVVKLLLHPGSVHRYFRRASVL